MALTYVVGYDGSDAARAALRMTAKLAGVMDARVVAVHSTPPEPFTWVPGAAANLGEGGALDKLRDLSQHMLAEIEDPAIEREAAVADSPAHGLQLVAEARGASLIAVGVTHHGPLGRLVPGSVGEHLLHGAPCPVMATPPTAGLDVRTVGVAYDGRSEAESALRTATSLAERLGARLVLIGATGPDLRVPSTLPGMFLAVQVADRRDVEAVLERAVAALPERLDAEARPVGGPSGPSIATACLDGVDLLVCGSRAYGPLRSVLLGSVSRYLVDHVPCPVVVVPRGVETDVDRPGGREAGAVA